MAAQFDDWLIKDEDEFIELSLMDLIFPGDNKDDNLLRLPP